MTITAGRSGLIGPDHLGLLLELLEIPTVNPLEALEQNRLREALSRYALAAAKVGLVVKHFEAAPVRLLDAPYVPVAVKEQAASAGPDFLDSQPNLVLCSPGPLDPSRTVLFNFHMDTVAGDFPVGLAGGRVTGRGAVDDKGPGVAVLAGYEAACRLRPDLVDEISVVVAAVGGEEGGAMGVYGTRAVVEAGYVGRLQVFCEPTGNRFFDHCTTSMTAAIDVRGDDACDDVAHEGHNATVLLGFLANWFALEVLPRIESVGGRCCIAGSHTGTRHNKVYGSGRMFLNMAYSDSDAHPAIARCVEQGLATGIERFTAMYTDHPSLFRTAKDAAAIASVSWMKRGLPALANRDGDLEAMLAQTVGVPRIDESSQDQPFTCDAIWAGAPGRYTVVCGPGTLGSNRAHGDGEFVDVDDLDRFATIVRDLILAFGAWVSR